MNTCKTCKHWTRTEGDFNISYHGAHSGNCDSDKFTESDKVRPDGLNYWDYEGYSAGFETGEDFGCVHWTPAAHGEDSKED